MNSIRIVNQCQMRTRGDGVKTHENFVNIFNGRLLRESRRPLPRPSSVRQSAQCELKNITKEEGDALWLVRRRRDCAYQMVSIPSWQSAARRPSHAADRRPCPFRALLTDCSTIAINSSTSLELEFTPGIWEATIRKGVPLTTDGITFWQSAAHWPSHAADRRPCPFRSLITD